MRNTCIYYVQQLSLFSIRKTTFTHVKLRYSSVPDFTFILSPVRSYKAGKTGKSAESSNISVGYNKI